MPASFSAILQRIRSFSLSIGQMTFGSFLLLLTVITATGMASVIAIRHIDTTFGELRRLQDVGDLAEEIDRCALRRATSSPIPARSPIGSRRLPPNWGRCSRRRGSNLRPSSRT